MTQTSHQRPSRRNRRGFTLLELLIAITILASISALVATLWSQTNAWAGENGITHKTMRLPRVRELMRAQWADRRGAFRLSSSGASVVPEPDCLGFITASPMIFPDWPMVRAEYKIERDYDTPAGMPPAWRLAYIETRISDLTKPPEKSEDLLAAGQNEEAGRYVLLSGLSSLSFDRFGVGIRSIRKNGSRVEPEEPSKEQEAQGPSITNRTPDKDEDEQRWRPFDEPFDGWIPAVRILGDMQGEAFSCVFVIEASR